MRIDCNKTFTFAVCRTFAWYISPCKGWGGPECPKVEITYTVVKVLFIAGTYFSLKKKEVELQSLSL